MPDTPTLRNNPAAKRLRDRYQEMDGLEFNGELNDALAEAADAARRDVLERIVAANEGLDLNGVDEVAGEIGADHDPE